MQCHRCWGKGSPHFPWPAGDTLPKVAQDAVSLICYEGTNLAHGQFVLYQDCMAFSAKQLSSWSFPSLYWCIRPYVPRYKTAVLTKSQKKKLLKALSNKDNRNNQRTAYSILVGFNCCPLSLNNKDPLKCWYMAQVPSLSFWILF